MPWMTVAAALNPSDRSSARGFRLMPKIWLASDAQFEAASATSSMTATLQPTELFWHLMPRPRMRTVGIGLSMNRQ
jgi:hypothetical protein